MGDRVRLVGTSTPTPSPGVDPLGYVDDWLTVMEHTAQTHIVDLAKAPSLGFHLNYDGAWTIYSLSKLLAVRNPSLSATLWTWGEDLMYQHLWPYSTLQVGPTESPSGAAGYYNYNMGCWAFARDPAFSPTGASGSEDWKQFSANWARGSAYSNHYLNCGVYLLHGDNTYPSLTTTFAANPPSFGKLLREYGRALHTHITEHADFDDHEDRLYQGTVEYLWCHDEFIWRYAGRYFLEYDVDLGDDPEVQGGLPYHTYVGELVDAVNGDFTQVEQTWTTDWAVFMWVHMFWGLMAYYEDDAFTGSPHHDNIKAMIPNGVYQLCDMAIAYHQAVAANGSWEGFVYRISEGGTKGNAAIDLNMWCAIMFAWAWNKSGNQQYYDMAVKLIRYSILGAQNWYLDAWPLAKQWNQNVMGAWLTFQLLGWTNEEFKLPWKYDIAGGEAWPSSELL